MRAVYGVRITMWHDRVDEPGYTMDFEWSDHELAENFDEHRQLIIKFCLWAAEQPDILDYGVYDTPFVTIYEDDAESSRTVYSEFSSC